MSRINIKAAVAMVILPSLLAGIALAAQDRYSLQVPGGLAWSEFKGYEDWQVISVSHNGDKMALDCRESCDDRGLQGGYSRQRQAVPGRRQDGQDPLGGEEA